MYALMFINNFILEKICEKEAKRNIGSERGIFSLLISHFTHTTTLSSYILRL